MKSRACMLLIFMIFVCVNGGAIATSDNQNFEIVGYIPKSTGIMPGGGDKPEYYGHLMVRDLYFNTSSVEDGKVLEIGQGLALFDKSNMTPLFRIEYATNYLDPVKIEVKLSPFTQYDKINGNPIENTLNTYAMSVAGIQANHDVFANVINFFSVPVNDNGDSSLKADGARMVINDQKSTPGNNVFAVRSQSSQITGTSVDTFEFSYEEADTSLDFWDYNNGKFTYYSQNLWHDTYPPHSAIPDGDRVTNYIEYYIRIDDEVPKPDGVDALYYRMTVRVSVTAGDL